MRLSGTKTSSVNQYNGLGDQLYDLGGARPTLDLNFSSNESLVDSVTGKTLVDHTRASSATYVDGDGVIRTAVTNLLLQSEDFSQTAWTKFNLSVTATTTTAPDNVSNANLITDDNTASVEHLLRQIPTSGAGSFTVSFFVKQGTGSRDLRIRAGDSGGFIGHVYFNPRTGAFRNSYGPLTFDKISLPGQWFRVHVSFASTSTNSQFALNYTEEGATSTTYDGDGTSGLYLWGAQLEESSTVGQYVKTTSAKNGAPRFDHDPTTGESLGLLVEESRTNLVTYSEEFDNAIWGPARVTVSTESITSPAGDATVQKLKETATTGTHFTNESLAVAASTVHTLSFFAKSAERTLIDVIVGQGTAYTARGFNLSTGVSVAPASTLPDAGTVNSSIIAYPNGWYRVSVTMTSTQANTVGTAQIRLRDGNSISYTGDGTSGIYVWGAQLEEGSFPTSYIRTEGSTVTRAADVTSITGRNFGSVNLLKYSEEFDDSFWQKGFSSVIPNQTTAPNGTFTADKLVEDSSLQQHYVWHLQPVTAGVTYTKSCYVKAAGRDAVDLVFSNYNSTFANEIVRFNLLTGSVIGTPSAGLVNYGIESAGNGWYRIYASATAITTSSTINGVVYLSNGSTGYYTGDGTSGIYVWGAQLEEGSTATDYIKSDVNWTSRASNATYYDVNGTLKKSSYNLLTYSEEFDNGTWTLQTGTTVTANQAIAPNGTLTADLIEGNGSNGLFSAQIVVSGSSPNTKSVWLKAVTGTATVLLKDAHQTVGSTTCSLTTTWQRFSLTETQSGGSGRLWIDDIPAAGIYAWGAQLETGTYAGDYAKTEASAASTARTAAYLPDGNGNFVSAGDLLLESAGTNLVNYSEDFSNWANTGARTTITVNAATAPDGTNTADKLIPNTEDDTHVMFKTIATITGTISTFSIYAKAGEYDKFTLLMGGGGFGASVEALYDLTNGTFTVTTSGTNTTSSITNVGNGWYRCAISSEATATSTPQHQIRLKDESGNGIFAGDDVKGLFVWGGQVEYSPYPTSYIFTQGSTATRATDVSTSAATFGNSWYEQGEGTVFADSQKNYNGSTGYPRIVQISDATNNNALLMLWAEPVNRLYATVTVSGSPVADIGNNTLTQTAAHKSAFGYKINDFAVSNDGLSVQADTSGTVPTVDRIFIGKDVGASYLNGTINRLTYWPTRLSNDTLQTITV